jgi:hypothetical protein
MLDEPRKGRWSLRSLRANTLFFVGLAIAAVVGGTLLAAFALIPDIELVRTETLRGNLNASSQQNLSFPVDVGLTELRLEVGNCTVFVTVLSETQWSHYNASGQLPNPQLSCSERSATFYYQLRALILQNDGLSTEVYQIQARLYAVRSSRALLAIPAFPLILGGSSFLVLRFLQRGIDRIHEDRKTNTKR